MKKLKFNAFDALLVLVVLALLVGVYLKFGALGTKTVEEKNGTPVTYTLQISPVREISLSQLQVGDTIYYGSSDTVMGVITDIQVEPATTTTSDATDEDGDLLVLTYEDRYCVTLTISGTALESESLADSYQVGDITLLTNRSDSYHTRYVSFSATLTGFELQG